MPRKEKNIFLEMFYAETTGALMELHLSFKDHF